MKFLIFSFVILSGLQCFCQGENIFNNSKVHEVRIFSYHTSDWDSIVNRYVPKVYTPMSVKINGAGMDSVGLRIKGNSFDPVSMANKKYQPFRLKFGKFINGQKYDGLKDVNLHSHDLLTNFLGYNVWRTSGLIAPRTSFARLYFDDVFIGLYMFVDEIDKVFLKSYYGNDDGNLYKADGKGANFSWLGSDPDLYEAYALETNTSSNNKSDLIALLNSIYNTPENTLIDSISKYLNLDVFLNSMAIEMYICKRDAFYDSGHNYFLYHNTASRKFEYMPWDLDVSFQTYDPFNLNFISNSGAINNPFVNKILNNSVFKQKYYSAVCELINSTALNKDRLTSLINNTELFLNANSMSFSNSSGMSINDVKSFVSMRKGQIENNFIGSAFNCRPNSVVENNTAGSLIKVYPNPASSILNIHSGNNLSIIRCELFDILGQKVADYSLQDNVNISRINLSSVVHGFYAVRIYLSNGANLVKKIIKMPF